MEFSRSPSFQVKNGISNCQKYSIANDRIAIGSIVESFVNEQSNPLSNKKHVLHILKEKNLNTTLSDNSIVITEKSNNNKSYTENVLCETITPKKGVFFCRNLKCQEDSKENKNGNFTTVETERKCAYFPLGQNNKLLSEKIALDKNEKSKFPNNDSSSNSVKKSKHFFPNLSTAYEAIALKYIPLSTFEYASPSSSSSLSLDNSKDDLATDRAIFCNEEDNLVSDRKLSIESYSTKFSNDKCNNTGNTLKDNCSSSSCVHSPYPPKPPCIYTKNCSKEQFRVISNKARKENLFAKKGENNHRRTNLEANKKQNNNSAVSWNYSCDNIPENVCTPPFPRKIPQIREETESKELKDSEKQKENRLCSRHAIKYDTEETTNKHLTSLSKSSSVARAFYRQTFGGNYAKNRVDSCRDAHVGNHSNFKEAKTPKLSCASEATILQSPACCEEKLFSEEYKEHHRRSEEGNEDFNEKEVKACKEESLKEIERKRNGKRELKSREEEEEEEELAMVDDNEEEEDEDLLDNKWRDKSKNETVYNSSLFSSFCKQNRNVSDKEYPYSNNSSSLQNSYEKEKSQESLKNKNNATIRLSSVENNTFEKAEKNEKEIVNNRKTKEKNNCNLVEQFGNQILEKEGDSFDSTNNKQLIAIECNNKNKNCSIFNFCKESYLCNSININSESNDNNAANYNYVNNLINNKEFDNCSAANGIMHINSNNSNKSNNSIHMSKFFNSENSIYDNNYGHNNNNEAYLIGSTQNSNEDNYTDMNSKNFSNCSAKKSIIHKKDPAKSKIIIKNDFLNDHRMIEGTNNESIEEEEKGVYLPTTRSFLEKKEQNTEIFTENSKPKRKRNAFVKCFCDDNIIKNTDEYEINKTCANKCNSNFNGKHIMRNNSTGTAIENGFYCMHNGSENEQEKESNLNVYDLKKLELDTQKVKESSFVQEEEKKKVVSKKYENEQKVDSPFDFFKNQLNLLEEKTTESKRKIIWSEEDDRISENDNEERKDKKKTKKVKFFSVLNNIANFFVDTLTKTAKPSPNSFGDFDENGFPHFISFYNLASAEQGSKILFATDEMLGAAKNILKLDEPTFEEGVCTQFGRYIDGWETRRRRTEGYDWCLIKLAFAGLIKGIDIDTSYCEGNCPACVSIQAAFLSHDSLDDSVIYRYDSHIGASSTDEEIESVLNYMNKVFHWVDILKEETLTCCSEPKWCHNYFKIDAKNTSFTHLKLSLHPDGAIARIRVYGDFFTFPESLNLFYAEDQKVGAMKKSLQNAKKVELSSAVFGGIVLLCSNFSTFTPNNLLLPDCPTRKCSDEHTIRYEKSNKQLTANDEGRIDSSSRFEHAIIKMGFIGKIECIEIYASAYCGNKPMSFSLEACDYEDLHSKEYFEQKKFFNENEKSFCWTKVVSNVLLQPNKIQSFCSSRTKYEYKHALPIFSDSIENVTHARLKIFPDGIISRFRIWGEISSLKS